MNRDPQLCRLQQPPVPRADVHATVSLMGAMAFVLSLGYAMLLPQAAAYVADLRPGASAAVAS